MTRSHHDTAAQTTLDQLLNLILRLLWLLLVMLLLPVVLLLLAMTALIPSSRISTTRVITILVPTGLLRKRRSRADLSASEVDIHPALVGLGGIIETQLATDLLDPGFDLLDMAGAVVAPANDDVQVRLTPGLGVTDPHLQYVLGFLDELPVEIDGVLGYAAHGVVLPEDELGGLLVVGILFGRVAFPFL